MEAVALIVILILNVCNSLILLDLLKKRTKEEEIVIIPPKRMHLKPLIQELEEEGEVTPGYQQRERELEGEGESVEEREYKVERNWLNKGKQRG